jgi:predicted nucleic acid-binding protein
MAGRILDTSILIRHWRTKAIGTLSNWNTEDATEWAGELIELRRADAIVSPVYVEFVAGVRSSHELQLARAYLARFRVVHAWNVLAADWTLARQFAERVPKDGKPRQLGDCLIRAIAERLTYDVDRIDVRFAR